VSFIVEVLFIIEVAETKPKRKIIFPINDRLEVDTGTEFWLSKGERKCHRSDV
jgi:hypothetical protein